LDAQTLKALDFERIRTLLAEGCSTSMGREKILQLEPSLSRDRAESEYERLAEMLTLDAEPPFAGMSDIRQLLREAEAGRVLSAEELLRVRQVCASLNSCRQFFLTREHGLRVLRALVGLIPDVRELQRAIERAVDDSGAFRDNASDLLNELRSEIRERRNRLVEQLEQMIETEPEWFAGTVMVRRERFVVPVRVEFKNQIAGVVHSVSASGQTVFIEPLATITEQNRLQELRDAEREEIERIQRELSDMVVKYAVSLRAGISAVADLDALLAKRRFVIKFDCHQPMIDEDGRVELVKARHPLLMMHRSEVVPLDFKPPDGVNVVVVSGPNAGGKTVVLKTLGVCALLMKSGIFIPAAAGSRLPWFERVFADIGDEQSLEADISSFTAHLHRLKQILDGADARSLVLIDEIGSATAPEEGSALAIAVLEELRHRQVFTVATTHFSSLKVFVQNEHGMINAGMEFRNGPTYRLLMGLPGESSAFEIAEQSGLPSALISRARERMGSEWLDFKAKLQQLNMELDSVTRARHEAEVQQKRAEALIREYESKLAEFERWQMQERKRQLLVREQELKEWRRRIENLVRELRERRADRESIVQTKSFIADELKDVEAQLSEVRLHSLQNEELPHVFAVGDEVESELFRRRGKVVEHKGERVVVEFGNIKLEVDPRGLRLARPASQPRPAVSEEFEFVPHLNIRGMTRDEAEIAVSRFLSEAVIAGAVELSILHGKGTGTLRQMLWKKLRQDTRVAEIRFAEPAEGGMGVTIVKLHPQGNRTGEK